MDVTELLEIHQKLIFKFDREKSIRFVEDANLVIDVMTRLVNRMTPVLKSLDKEIYQIISLRDGIQKEIAKETKSE